MALPEKLAAQGQEYQAHKLPSGFSFFLAERSVKRQNVAAQRCRAVLLLLPVTATAAAAGKQQQRRPRQQQLRQESHLRQQRKGLVNGSNSSSTPKTAGNPATCNFLRAHPSQEERSLTRLPCIPSTSQTNASTSRWQHGATLLCLQTQAPQECSQTQKVGADRIHMKGCATHHTNEGGSR